MHTDNTDDRLASGVEAELLHYEIVADVLALPAPAVAVETPLAAEDEEALEAGIASMFEALLHSDAAADDAANDDGDDDGIEPTVALLAELNRIWAQPLAA
jgi:hypothetical protein